MAQVYFLVPGLIPGPAAKDKISGATIDRLRKTIGRLSDDPVLQPLGSSVFAKSVHLSWMWSVLTRRALPFTSAPYAWAVQNGPMLSGDIWSLTLSNRRKDGSLAPANLSHDDMEAACAALTPVLLDMGFVLQRWDPHLYLTRKKKLVAAAAPFDVVQTQDANPETWIEGAEKSELIKLLGACETTLAAMGSPAQTVWLCGGGGALSAHAQHDKTVLLRLADVGVGLFSHAQSEAPQSLRRPLCLIFPLAVPRDQHSSAARESVEVFSQRLAKGSARIHLGLSHLAHKGGKGCHLTSHTHLRPTS